jgi:hypothetical protein
LSITGGLPTATVSATPSPPVGFTDEFPTEQRGDVAEIGVRFSDAEVATVRVGNGSKHVLTAVVRDTDDDGRAKLRLNTYDGTVTASDGDAVAVRDRSNVTTPLAAGQYHLDLWVGNGTDGERCAVGTLVVRERSTDHLQTWVAPESADLTDLRDLREAKASENLTRSPVVSERDTLVLELRASGLDGAIVGQNASNATARFFAAFDGTVGNVTIRHLNPGTSQQRAVLDFRNHTATTVVPDSTNETYYIVTDLPNATMTGPDGEELHWVKLRSGEYRATVALSVASELAGPNESITTEFEIDAPTAHLDMPRGTRRVFVAPAADEIVSGTTPLAPGNDLTVRVHDEIGNVLRSKTVTVENGTDGRHRFGATFDFREFESGRNVTVTVKIPDGPMLHGSRTGQEGTPGIVAATSASVNLTERRLTERRVPVENAVLSHGGYLAVHRGSPDGEVLARSARLAPGEEFSRFLEFDAALKSNATLVAVAHRDGLDALGEPYTENRSVVADSVAYIPATGTETTTEDATTTVRTTADATTTPATDSEGTIPGFGVGVTPIALLVGVLVAATLAARK